MNNSTGSYPETTCDIVFINPPLSVKERYGVRFQSGGQTPPLGLANLAAMTRKRGFQTKILDAPAEQWTHEDVVTEVKKLCPRAVGLTAVTISIGHAHRLAEAIKASLPETLIIIGGPHLTALPTETMQKFPSFDVGVVGEADFSIVELLSHHFKREPFGGVRSLLLREAGGIRFTGARDPILDLDVLPFPAWDLLPNLATHYSPPVHTLRRSPGALLVASRGCPGKCIFCDRSVFGNHLRAYSAEYTFELIRELYSTYGIREIQIRDDNFLAFPGRLKKLCAILKKEKLDLSWTCLGRIDMLNPENLRLMKDAGCWQIWYGIESGSNVILKTIKKHTTIEQTQKIVRQTAKAGISPCGFFILGNPGETCKTLEETIQFALKLPLGSVHFSYMTPFPGSELYQRAQEFGTFNNDWTKLNGWIPTFVPHGLTSKDLESASKRAFWGFYFRPRIVLSFLRRIRSIDQMKTYFRGFLALLEWIFVHSPSK